MKVAGRFALSAENCRKLTWYLSPFRNTGAVALLARDNSELTDSHTGVGKSRKEQRILVNVREAALLAVGVDMASTAGGQ